MNQLSVFTKTTLVGATLLAFFVMALPAAAQVTVAACPLVAQEGRILVDFDGTSVRSDLDVEQARTPTVSTLIPAGVYDVTLASFDGYASRAQDAQQYERWSVVLRDTDSIIAQTHATDDLQDGIEEVMETTMLKQFILERDATAAIALHANFPSFDINNVTPICAAFDTPVSEEEVDMSQDEMLDTEAEPEMSAMVVGQDKPNDAEVAITAMPAPIAATAFEYPTDAVGRCAFVTESLGFGADNPRSEVNKLQSFLSVFEGADVEITGVFDTKTLYAVTEFQRNYAQDILAPWGLSKATGYVGITTRHTINEIYCGKDLPFTPTEQAAMSTIRDAALMANMALEVVEEPVVEEMPVVAVAPEMPATAEEAPIVVTPAAPTIPTVTVEEYPEPADAEEMEEKPTFDISRLLEMSVTSQRGQDAPTDVAIDEDLMEEAVPEEMEPVARDEEMSDSVTQVDTREEDAQDENTVVAVAASGPDVPASAQGVEQTAAVIVGFIDRFSLPILIVLVMLLAVQIYVLWKAPREQAF
jgi:hypothetical protein